MSVNGAANSSVNSANGFKISLKKGNGVIKELKANFKEMLEAGKIRVKDGQSKGDLFAAIDKIHRESGMNTNYTRMKVGEEFNYNESQLNQLLAAAGYELVTPQEAPFVEEPPKYIVEPEPLEEKKEPETEPEIQTQPEIAPKPQLVNLPNGAKQELRDIKNIGPEGSKETVVTTKNKDGVKVYHQVETDPETGEAKMGKRLAVDGRGAKKNEYYAIDETIPDGVEVDTDKTVDGKKDVMTYTVKEKDGKTHRYTMVQNDDGTYAKGEPLVQIYGSNKFMSQSALNAASAQVFPNGVPEGIDVQVLNMNGSEVLIYKKDGKTLTQSQVKELAKPVKEAPVEENKVVAEESAPTQTTWTAPASKSAPVASVTPNQIEEPTTEEIADTYVEEEQEVELETDESDDEIYISNMMEIVTSRYPDAQVFQGEFGFELTTADGRTIEFGNTSEELERVEAFMRGEDVE